MTKDQLYMLATAGAIIGAGLVLCRKPRKVVVMPENKNTFSFSLDTNHKKMTVVVPIETDSPQKIRLKMWDADNPKTYLTDRYMTVSGLSAFEIMLPVAPKKAMVSVFSEQKGTFRIGEITENKLKTRLDLINMLSPSVRSFIKFSQDFAYNCSYLDAGQTYMSDDKQFFIELLPQITSESGKVINTSARINKQTGIIQVSKRDFDSYTFPMRMAVLLHEYSHVNINDNVDDESEADLNGLLIYLGLGYPRVEAFEAWADVFEGAPTAQNRERAEIMRRFIDDFENNKIV